MIEKFITIKGIGLLHNALPSGALALKKINAIYAENGRGKSTFAAMCRSLTTGDAQTILVKRSFGGQHEPEVHLRIHGQNYQFRDGQWDKSYSKILVYDEDFVEKNVYSGNRIEAMHRENLLEFALGETGVSLKKEIDAITEEIEGINTELRNLEREINQQKGPYQVAEFVALQPGPDIDSRLTQAAKRLNDAENIDALKRRPSLSPIIMPEFNLGDIEQLLASSLDNVAEDAECKVKMHIEQCLGSGAENWIRQGLNYLNNEISTCPFCGQNVYGVDLIDAYKSYFNASYENLKRRIMDTLKEVQKKFGEDKWVEIREMLKHNADAEVIWSDRSDLSFPSVPAKDDLQFIWQTLRNEAVSILTDKAATPLSVMAVPASLRKAYARYEEVRIMIEAYSKSVSKVNTVIDSLRASLETINFSALREEIQRLQAERRRIQPDIADYCQRYHDLQERKRRLESSKSQKRDELEQYTESLLSRYKDTINELLRRFGAGFSIEAFSIRYTRGTPRTDYGLMVMGKSVPLAPQSGAVVPSFANTLSSGDKRTLALAFFLARVRLESELRDHIIIVDDPVASFDAGRRRATYEVLIDISQQCSQLIVLSHDAVFLRDFVNKIRDNEAWQALQIKRYGTYSVIEECDIYRICQEEYYRVYERLMRYLQEGPSGDETQIAEDIRIYLEYNLRYRFPIEFANMQSLGQMNKRIQQNPEEFGQIGRHLKDLETLHNFSSPLHHGTIDRPKRLTDTELKHMVELALEIGRG